MKKMEPSKERRPRKQPKRLPDAKRAEEIRQMIREDIKQHRELIDKMRRKMN